MKPEEKRFATLLPLLIILVAILSFSIAFGVSRHNSLSGNIDRFRPDCRRAMLIERQPQAFMHVAKHAGDSSDSSGVEWEFRMRSSSEHGMHVLIDSVSPLLSDGRGLALLKIGNEEVSLKTQASGADSISFNHEFAYGLFPDEWMGQEQRLDFRYPVEGSSRITQADGMKSFFDARTHLGGKMHAVDIKAELGSVVRNGRDGVVVHALDGYPDAGCNLPELSGKANTVVIRHKDGSEAVYGHLMRSSIRVKEGASVRAGQPIAKVGNSGRSSVPHLHLQVGGLTEAGYKTFPLRFYGCQAKPGFVPVIGSVDC